MSTTSTTTPNSHIHQSRYKVVFPDGSRFDIRTKEGVDGFLQNEVDFSRQYISNTLRDAMAILEKPELDQEDKECVMQAYTLMHMISLNASKPVFQEVMLEQKSDSIIRLWFDLAMAELKKFSTKPSWMLTGILSEFEESVLHPCVTLILHTGPVVIAFDNGFFSVLADFIRARKGSGGGLPSPMICCHVASIVFYACILTTQEFKPCWEPEKAFEKLEASGLLEQWFRVVTVPQFPDSDTLMSQLLDMLAQKCNSYFLNIKFRRGTQCGDTLRELVDGKDGSKVERPVVMTRLRGLAHKVDMSGGKGHMDFVRVQCEYCGKSGSSQKFQKSLLTCSRCKQTRYCSKDCQRADWKTHKKSCAPPGSSNNSDANPKEQKTPASVEVGLGQFVLQNGKNIAIKLTEACERTGLTIDDMVIEVDFMPNAKGIIPALQTPGCFKVAPLQDYVDGKEVPTWVLELEDATKLEAAKTEILNCSKQMQDMKGKNKTCLYFANCKTLCIVHVQTTETTFMNHMVDALFDNFIKKNRQAILDKVAEECKKHKLTMMKDLVMELDFVPNKKGVFPSMMMMQTSPSSSSSISSFKIVPAKRYLDKSSKSRTKDKDWFFNHQKPQVQPSMKKAAIQVVRDCPREAGDLLCFLHYYGGLADRIFSSPSNLQELPTNVNY